MKVYDVTQPAPEWKLQASLLEPFVYGTRVKSSSSERSFTAVPWLTNYSILIGQPCSGSVSCGQALRLDVGLPGGQFGPGYKGLTLVHSLLPIWLQLG